MKMILKGILLYLTVLFIMFFIMGADSILDNFGGAGIILGICIITLLSLTCKEFITEDELKTLTLYHWFNDKDEEL